jgi:hypothetical protein
VSWAQDKARRGRKMAPQEMSTEGELGPVQYCKKRRSKLKGGGRRPEGLPLKGKYMPESLPPQKGGHEIEVSPQGSSSKGERRGGRNAQRQGRRKLDAPSRADRTEGRLTTCDPAY